MEKRKEVRDSETIGLNATLSEDEPVRVDIFFFKIGPPPRTKPGTSSAASGVYKGPLKKKTPPPPLAKGVLEA